MNKKTILLLIPLLAIVTVVTIGEADAVFAKYLASDGNTYTLYSSAESMTANLDKHTSKVISSMDTRIIDLEDMKIVCTIEQ